MLTKSLRPAAARYSPHLSFHLPLAGPSPARLLHHRLCLSSVRLLPPLSLCIRSPISGYQLTAYAPATMMLLIGMKINFTKKPINPMIAKPTEVA